MNQKTRAVDCEGVEFAGESDLRLRSCLFTQARVRGSRACESALISEPLSARTIQNCGVVNCIIADDRLIEEATGFARRLVNGPALANAAHKAWLRAWAFGGISAADEVLFDEAKRLFETDDLPASVTPAVDLLVPA